MVAQKIISLFCLGILSACANDVTVDDLEDPDAAVTMSAVVFPTTENQAYFEQMITPEGDAIKQIVIQSEPYMSADFNQWYALLFIRCNFDQTMTFDLRSFQRPPEINEDGLVVGETGEIMFGNYLSQFWQNPTVATFLDEVQITNPPMYKTITKQIQINGQYETRAERELINEPSALGEQFFLPNLKAAKVMRIDYGGSVGPIFRLGEVSKKIEKLEAQCVPKDSQK